MPSHFYRFRVIDKCHPFYPVNGIHPESYDLAATDVADNLDHFYVHSIRISAARCWCLCVRRFLRVCVFALMSNCDYVCPIVSRSANVGKF